MTVDGITLQSGLGLSLLDQTRHYFGGYYHVKVCVCGDIPLHRDCFESDAEYTAAREILGEMCRFEQILEKMAVAAADVESVRSQLIHTFRETTGRYLATSDFERRFVRKEYLKRLRTPRKYD